MLQQIKDCSSLSEDDILRCISPHINITDSERKNICTVICEKFPDKFIWVSLFSEYVKTIVQYTEGFIELLPNYDPGIGMTILTKCIYWEILTPSIRMAVICKLHPRSLFDKKGVPFFNYDELEQQERVIYAKRMTESFLQKCYKPQIPEIAFSRWDYRYRRDDLYIYNTFPPPENIIYGFEILDISGIIQAMVNWEPKHWNLISDENLIKQRVNLELIMPQDDSKLTSTILTRMVRLGINVPFQQFNCKNNEYDFAFVLHNECDKLLTDESIIKAIRKISKLPKANKIANISINLRIYVKKFVEYHVIRLSDMLKSP